jgi:hypothetical protein
MGPPGLSGVERVSFSWVVRQLQGATAIAICPFPKKVLGGGYTSEGFRLSVGETRPWESGEGWQVQAYNGSAFLVYTLTAFAICANSN